jgi:bifunctional non-homologous end joining protein LigD
LRRGRTELQQVINGLPDTIRYSETFHVPLPNLEHAVREHRVEGIVAKRAGSPYRSGERSGDWLKWRANRSQEFAIGGYIPHHNILIHYWSGTTSAVRLCTPPTFVPEYHTSSGVRSCHFLTSFRYLDAHSLTYRNAARVAGEKGLRLKMSRCRWLHPFLVARIEFLEWTPENRLRHPRFAGIGATSTPRTSCVNKRNFFFGNGGGCCPVTLLPFPRGLPQLSPCKARISR